MRQVNQKTLTLIKEFESLRLTAYRDMVGVLTIGYGHTGPDVTEGLQITQEQADVLLEQDLQKFCRGVDQLVRVPLSENQFGALVSFAFNLGLGNLLHSTLLRVLNQGRYNDAAAQFVRWNRAGGEVVDGLTRRRLAEATLFTTKDDT